VSDEYRVPKNQVSARVVLPHRPEEQLTLFLGERAERHSGPERPSDLLNGDSRFIPVEFSESGFALLRRASVLLMVVRPADELLSDDGREDPTGPESGGSGARRRGVRLVMDDGTEVGGTVEYVMPPGESRLQDFLNEADAFIRVRDGDRVQLVNTARIALARLV